MLNPTGRGGPLYPSKVARIPASRQPHSPDNSHLITKVVTHWRALMAGRMARGVGEKGSRVCHALLAMRQPFLSRFLVNPIGRRFVKVRDAFPEGAARADRDRARLAVTRRAAATQPAGSGSDEDNDRGDAGGDIEARGGARVGVRSVTPAALGGKGTSGAQRSPPALALYPFRFIWRSSGVVGARCA